MRKLKILVTAFCLVFLPITTMADVALYFTGSRYNGQDGGYIFVARHCSSEPQLIVTTAYNGRPMMAETYGEFLYWTTYYPGQLWRSDIDGQGQELLVDQGDTTTRAIRFFEDRVYWANEHLGIIYSARLDGSQIERVISGYLGNSRGIWDFEIYNGRIYWTSWHSNKVQSVLMDGTDYQDLDIEGASRIFNIEIANGRFLLSDTYSRAPDRILSTDLKGLDIIEIVSGVKDSLQSLDIYENRLYFGSNTLIESVEFDGSDQRTEVIAPNIQIWQIHAGAAIGPCPAYLIAVEVVNGDLLNGDVSQLESSDDLYIHLRSGFGTTIVDLHNMEMIVNAITTVDSPVTLGLKIESRIDESSGIAQIRLRNWNTNQFEFVGSYPLGNTDQVNTIDDIDATNYVNTSGGGEIDLSIKHLVFVPFFAFTFESFIDQVEIVVE